MYPELTELRLIAGEIAVVSDHRCCSWPVPAKTQKDPHRRCGILHSQYKARTTLYYPVNGNHGGSWTLTLPSHPLSGFLN